MGEWLVALAHAIDGRLMGWCTQFAHWFQQLTGRTSFFIAKLGISLCVWSLLIMIGDYWFPVLQHNRISLGPIIPSLMLISFFRNIVQCNKAEESLYDGKLVLPAWVIRQRIESGIWWRLLGVLWSLMYFAIAIDISWADALSGSYLPGITIFWYFIHVDPLPPGTSKFREWIESFGLKPKEVHVQD